MVKDVLIKKDPVTTYDNKINNALNYKIVRIFARPIRGSRDLIRNQLRRQLGLNVNFSSNLSTIHEIEAEYNPSTTIREINSNINNSEETLVEVPFQPTFQPPTQNYNSNHNVINGINIDVFYNNLQYYSFNYLDLSNNPAILFLDFNNHTHTFLAEFIDHLTENSSRNHIFVNNSHSLYYEEFTDTFDIIRGHIIFDQTTNALLHSQRYNIRNGGNERHFLVIDQPTNDVLRSDSFKELIFNGRNHRMGFFTRIERSRNMPPEFRENYDIIILNPFSLTPSEIQGLYEKYFSVFPTLDIFRSVLIEFRLHNQYIVLDRRNTSNIYEKIFKIDIESL